MGGDWTELMQPLKALVIFLGIVIAAMVAVIGVTIFNRLSGPGENAEPTAATEGVSPGLEQLELPPGCQIAEIEAVNGRLWLRLEGGSQCDLLLALDGKTGQLLQRIQPAP